MNIKNILRHIFVATAAFITVCFVIGFAGLVLYALYSPRVITIQR